MPCVAIGSLRVILSQEESDSVAPGDPIGKSKSPSLVIESLGVIKSQKESDSSGPSDTIAAFPYLESL